MVEIETSINASAPAFTFLIYESLKSEFYQEGLLLGDIVEKETKTITDNDRQHTSISRTIRVTSVLPFPMFLAFYNDMGKIDENHLKSLLGDSKPNVIAWYKYKPINHFSLTFREKIIHKQLAQYFNVPKEMFTICLLISDKTPNGSTHSFQQTFLRCRNNRYQAVPFHIVNLTDKKNCYKTPEPLSTSFRKIINKLDVNSRKIRGVSFVTKLQQKAEEYMESLSQQLEEEENELFELEKKLEHLKNKQNENGFIENHLQQELEQQDKKYLKQ